MLMLMSVLTMYFVFPNPYQLTLFVQYGLVENVSVFFKDFNFDSLNLWSSLLPLYFNLAGLEHFFKTPLVLKITIAVLFVGIVAIHSLLMRKKSVDATLMYLSVTLLSSTVFVFGDLQFLFGVLLALVVFLGITIDAEKRRGYGVIAVAYTFMAYVNPLLSLALLPVFLFEIFKETGFSKTTTKRKLMLLPGVLFIGMFALKFVIADSTFNYEIAFKGFGEPLIGFVSSVHISSEFDNLKFLLPLIFLVSPFLLGFGLTKNIHRWGIFVYMLALYWVYPKYFEGYAFYGYFPVILPLMVLPFLFEKKRDMPVYMMAFPAIIVFMSLISIFDKYIDYDREAKSLTKIYQEVNAHDSIWVEATDAGFNGFFNENSYMGQYLNALHDGRIGYGFENRFDSPIIPLEITRQDPYILKNTWESSFVKREYDLLLLRNCGDFKTDLIGANLVKTEGCWQLYSF